MSSQKFAWDGESIDWHYWANLPSISAKDACWLVCQVDPIICNTDSIENKYHLTDEKIIEIQKAITQIESDIRTGKEMEHNSPWNWVCWAESKGIAVPKKFHELAFKAKVESIHVIKAQPLEKLEDELLAWYMKQDSWTYYEAIFLIRGFKPPGDIEGFDEVRTHFPDEYLMLERGIAIGAIGQEVKQAGQKNFIDTPANWISWAKRKDCNVDHLHDFQVLAQTIYTIANERNIPSKIVSDKRGDKQIAAIVQQAKEFEYSPLSIPYGGKKKIKDECLKNLALFTDSSFDHAWKKARTQNLIEVDNVDSYRKPI